MLRCSHVRCHRVSDDLRRDTWRSNSAPNKDMKIYIGAMGAYTNGEDTGYVDPDTLKAFIDDTRSKFSSFGGVMLWDAELAAGALAL